MKRIPVDFNSLRTDNSLLVKLEDSEVQLNEEVVLYDSVYEELSFLGRVRKLNEKREAVIGVTWESAYGA